MNQEDTRRTLGAALLLARSDCCDVCRALIRVRDAVAPVLPDQPAAMPSTEPARNGTEYVPVGQPH